MPHRLRQRLQAQDHEDRRRQPPPRDPAGARVRASVLPPQPRARGEERQGAQDGGRRDVRQGSVDAQGAVDILRAVRRGHHGRPGLEGHARARLRAGGLAQPPDWRGEGRLRGRDLPQGEGRRRRRDGRDVHSDRDPRGRPPRDPRGRLGPERERGALAQGALAPRGARDARGEALRERQPRRPQGRAGGDNARRPVAEVPDAPAAERAGLRHEDVAEAGRRLGPQGGVQRPDHGGRAAEARGNRREVLENPVEARGVDGGERA